jgi:hypothetical protein
VYGGRERSARGVGEEGDLWCRGHRGDPDVDGSIILRLILWKMEELVGTGYSWLRIETCCGHS